MSSTFDYTINVTTDHLYTTARLTGQLDQGLLTGKVKVSLSLEEDFSSPIDKLSLEDTYQEIGYLEFKAGLLVGCQLRYLAESEEWLNETLSDCSFSAYADKGSGVIVKTDNYGRLEGVFHYPFSMSNVDSYKRGCLKSTYQADIGLSSEGILQLFQSYQMVEHYLPGLATITYHQNEGDLIEEVDAAEVICGHQDSVLVEGLAGLPVRAIRAEPKGQLTYAFQVGSEVTLPANLVAGQIYHGSQLVAELSPESLSLEVIASHLPSQTITTDQFLTYAVVVGLYQQLLTDKLVTASSTEPYLAVKL